MKSSEIQTDRQKALRMLVRERENERERRIYRDGDGDRQRIINQ